MLINFKKYLPNEFDFFSPFFSWYNLKLISRQIDLQQSSFWNAFWINFVKTDYGFFLISCFHEISFTRILCNFPYSMTLCLLCVRPSLWIPNNAHIFPVFILYLFILHNFCWQNENVSASHSVLCAIKIGMLDFVLALYLIDLDICKT